VEADDFTLALAETLEVWQEKIKPKLVAKAFVRWTA
jgi:hypothetical protein